MTKADPADIAARDRAVADTARRFLDVALDNPATRTVLTWGLSDRYVDPPDEWRLKLAGFRYRKTPYDAAMAPRPSWRAPWPGPLPDGVPFTDRVRPTRDGPRFNERISQRPAPFYRPPTGAALTIHQAALPGKFHLEQVPRGGFIGAPRRKAPRG